MIEEAAPPRSPRIAAAIDVGSNSVHLLVAEVDVDGRTSPRHDESVLLGLGAVVDLDGHIPEAEATAAIEALEAYIATAVSDGAEWIVLLGTEPLRRAADRSRFADAVRDATGRPLHVLGHEEEAALTILSVLGEDPGREPLLVLDIGGGSSEVALLEPGSDPVVGILPVGSARLTASFIEGDPPTPMELEALRSEAHHLVSSMPAGHPGRGVVTGGSGTNLLRLIEGRAEDDMAITRARLDEVMRIVARRSSSELVDTYGLRERRAVQMAAGASLIEATLDCYALSSLEASDCSLRDGAILAWSRAGDAWRERLWSLISES